MSSDSDTQRPGSVDEKGRLWAASRSQKPPDSPWEPTEGSVATTPPASPGTRVRLQPWTLVIGCVVLGNRFVLSITAAAGSSDPGAAVLTARHTLRTMKTVHVSPSSASSPHCPGLANHPSSGNTLTWSHTNSLPAAVQTGPAPLAGTRSLKGSFSALTFPYKTPWLFPPGQADLTLTKVSPLPTLF